MADLCKKGTMSICTGYTDEFNEPEDKCDNYKPATSSNRCMWRVAGQIFCTYNDVIEDGKTISKRKEDD